MEYDMQFANLIRSKREELAMSQAALAGACDVHERTIIRIEGGARAAPETVMALCSVLGIATSTAQGFLTTPPRAKGEIDIIVPDALGENIDRQRRRAVKRIPREDTTLKMIVARDADAFLCSRLGQPTGAPKWTEGLVNAAYESMLPTYIKWARFLIRQLGSVMGTLGLIVSTLSCLAIVIVLAQNVAVATHSVLGWIIVLAPGVYLGYCANMMTSIGNRFYRLSNMSAQIFGLADDHIAIASGDDVSVVESSDIRSITCLRTATGHLTASVEMVWGPTMEIDFLPDDSRIERAFERISANARSAWASPVPGLAAAA